MDEGFESLLPTWFDEGVFIRHIQNFFPRAEAEIRIASGFFSVAGWNQIRRYTTGKRVYILVGIDEPGEERAEKVLIQEIMRELKTGLERNRRQAVQDWVDKMKAGQARLVDARSKRHHAKLYIIDRNMLILGSPNLSRRGLISQVESGGVIGPEHAEGFRVSSLVDRFDCHFAQAKDLTQALLEDLERWLQIASPWDIYLKTMLALEDLPNIQSKYKQPASYQRNVIARLLSQIRSYRGSLLVASTGLGKTVIATCIALYLFKAGEIDNVMVIGPKSVRHLWKRDMRESGLPHEYFVHQTLDRESADQDGSLEDFEDIVRNMSDRRWLIILDECQEFKNRYAEKIINGRLQEVERRAFTRLLSLSRESDSKVLLLTGSPYGTDISDINDQLLLLPHTGPSTALLDEFIEDSRAWRVNETDDFVHLPVTAQLTTPQVAKIYGQFSGEGIYIKFGEERRYIPRITLHRIDFPPPVEKNLIKAINEGYLALDSRHPLWKSVVEVRAKVAWGSSPWAIRDVLEKVLDTPGGERSYRFNKLTFRIPLGKRQQLLKPVLDDLVAMTFEADFKLLSLSRVLDEVCGANRKVIIFCELWLTAAYLTEALLELKPHLRVISTITKVEGNRYRMKKTRQIRELVEMFAPIANDAEDKHLETYDVFIATDAHGVGINMQDASVVINYDAAWTPIEPIQRAGRVLRPWKEPRTIDLYTFVPILSEETILKYDVSTVKRRWEKLVRRHTEARKLVDLPVITTDLKREIYMPDIASQVTITSAELDLEAAAEEDVQDPYFQNTANLELSYDYAKTIPDDIISAKTYSGSKKLIYVLVKCIDRYYWPLFEPEKGKLYSLTIDRLLSYIKCEPETQAAIAAPDEIEEWSDACIRAWCAQNNADPEDVERICTLYLKPEDATDSIKDLFATDDGAPIYDR